MNTRAFASSQLTPFALRLSPGDDLKEQLQAFTRQREIAAGCILTTVGSLQQAHLRFAGQASGILLHRRFEIVSLVGTLSQQGLHLHMAIADDQGNTLGGHVMTGCLVYTTAEIVVAALPGLTFERQPDEQTGYRELLIRGL